MAAPPTKAQRARAFADLEEAEEDFAKEKAKGLVRFEKARDAAASAATGYKDFKARLAKIEPPISNSAKLDIRAKRAKYRGKYRLPVQPGEGAAPGALETSATVEEAG